jgi:hypothetical protein
MHLWKILLGIQWKILLLHLLMNLFWEVYRNLGTVEPPYNDFSRNREKNLHREGINLWKIWFSEMIFLVDKFFSMISKVLDRSLICIPYLMILHPFFALIWEISTKKITPLYSFLIFINSWHTFEQCFPIQCIQFFSMKKFVLLSVTISGMI